MRLIVVTILVIASLLIPPSQPAHAAAEEKKPADGAAAKDAPVAKPKPEPEAPQLADIIPRSMKLSANATALENKVKSAPDPDALRKRYGEIEANIERLSGRLRQLKELKDYRYQKLVELKQAVARESEELQKVNEPLRQAITRLEAWKKEWLAAKKQWSELQQEFKGDPPLKPLEVAFAQADKAIERALELIVGQLGAMLTTQEKSGAIQAEMNSLTAEIDRLITAQSKDVEPGETPPLLSSRFAAQFGHELWYTARRGLSSVSWMDGGFFERQGYVILIQIVVSIAVIVGLYRNRDTLLESDRRRFLGERPISAGLYLAIMMSVLLYDQRGAPAGWRIAQTLVGGIAFARLGAAFTDAAWKRNFLYGLIALMALIRLIAAISLPLPLVRLSVVAISLAGGAACLRWSFVAVRRKELSLWVWALRVAALLFAIAIAAELWGRAELSQYLVVSVISVTALALGFLLFLYIVREAVDYAVTALIEPRLSLTAGETESVIRHVTILIQAAIVGYLICSILVTLRVYTGFEAAASGLLSLGFNLGNLRISVGSLIVAVGVVYGSFIVSRIIRKVFIDQELSKRQVERGVRISIAGLLHYLLLFIGFVLALLVLGFDLTKVTIILSALGVGIGFGLQGIVNNFISGLILLLERPVRVGDYIDVEGAWTEIKKIGLRATTVQTFDYSEIIVPNADLTTNKVTNWTLSNRLVRIIIPVGVAYGSDVDLVKERLLGCADGNEKVTKIPPPQALFLAFGESSLDFQLRCWVWDADEMLRTKSELHFSICQAFRDANIEISFPQRDLHLRSVDESIRLVRGENRRAEEAEREEQ